MQDLNILEKFNQYYKSSQKREYEKSLKDFFSTQVQNRLISSPRILDLGPGSKSLFEDVDLNAELITAIDFSSIAINKAKGHGSIDYQLRDISKDGSIEKNTYNLVFDSHCLHCILDPNDRSLAFKNIYEGLTTEGLFCAEMMVASKTGSNDPYKFTPQALELEQELLNSGFKIIYFMIMRDLVFQNDHGECDVVRVICRK